LFVTIGQVKNVALGPNDKGLEYTLASRDQENLFLEHRQHAKSKIYLHGLVDVIVNGRLPYKSVFERNSPRMLHVARVGVSAPLHNNSPTVPSR
jgi:hypothetical protein